MKRLRKNIFETNSSSTHVIAISKHDFNKDNLRDINFIFDEFGWSYNIFHNTKSKASYLITLIYSYQKDEADILLEKLKNILDKNNIKYTLPVVDKLYESWDKETYYDLDLEGYVDHSFTAKELVEDLLNNEDLLLRYLFNDESYISTGNDNEDGYRFDGIDSENPEEFNEKLHETFVDYIYYLKGEHLLRKLGVEDESARN